MVQVQILSAHYGENSKGGKSVMEISKHIVWVRNFYGKEYVEFDSYTMLADEMYCENSKLRDKVEHLKRENAELDKQNADIQESHMKLYNDSKDEIRRLKEEIQRLGGEYGHSEFDRISQLEDQHQQDCIRINDLTTTISVLSSLYTHLRKNAGMD